VARSVVGQKLLRWNTENNENQEETTKPARTERGKKKRAFDISLFQSISLEMVNPHFSATVAIGPNTL
jgi:hypothetical protein